jgi:imidazole glycerol-phosphate synthase subunit HisH
MSQVIVVDYGVGNVASVRRGFERLGAEVLLTGDAAAIATADRVVLPGVGAFAPAMESLVRSGLDAALRSAAGRGARLLGLCLGYQLLFEESEEFGTTKGLGLLRGRVAAFPAGTRTPHVGWNRIVPEPRAEESRILAGLPRESWVYFVHSFRPEGADAKDIAATTDYGGPFPSVAEMGNVWGCQFHPEKSSETGRQILRNFLEAAS